MSGFSTDLQADERPVGDGKLMSIVHRGSHAPGCQKTELGWICDNRCSVIDVPSIGLKRRVVNDELVTVNELVWRRWLKVRWKLERVSLRREFVNGRSMFADEDILYETWYEGEAWTKRGARKKMIFCRDHGPIPSSAVDRYRKLT